MKYEEVRNKIKTGDMILYRNHSGGGLRAVIERWIVAHGTASPYTHIGVAWVDYDRVFVMDITTRGCAPRLLSTTGSFDWVPSPKPISDKALRYAFDCFGEWTYSRWQAVLGGLGLLPIGMDQKGECAEYALAIWKVDYMAPTTVASPSACADAALAVWGSSITRVEQ